MVHIRSQKDKESQFWIIILAWRHVWLFLCCKGIKRLDFPFLILSFYFSIFVPSFSIFPSDYLHSIFYFPFLKISSGFPFPRFNSMDSSRTVPFFVAAVVVDMITLTVTHTMTVVRKLYSSPPTKIRRFLWWKPFQWTRNSSRCTSFLWFEDTDSKAGLVDAFLLLFNDSRWRVAIVFPHAYVSGNYEGCCRLGSPENHLPITSFSLKFWTPVSTANSWRNKYELCLMFILVTVRVRHTLWPKFISFPMPNNFKDLLSNPLSINSSLLFSNLNNLKRTEWLRNTEQICV